MMLADPGLLYLLAAGVGAVLLLTLLFGGDDGETPSDPDDVIRLTAGDDDFNQQLDMPSTGAVHVSAGSGDDIVLTGDGADTLALGDNRLPSLTGETLGIDIAISGYGDDVLYGEAGRDLLIAEHGNDTIYGGVGDDLVDDRHVDRDDLLASGGIAGLRTELMAGGVEFDPAALPFLDVSLQQPDNDLVYGGAGNDDLVSASGMDTLFGGTGDDVISALDLAPGSMPDSLFGGLGADVLTGDDGDQMSGGTGADVFIIDSRSSSIDPAAQAAVSIADYQPSLDAIEVVDSGEGGSLAILADESGGAVLRWLPETGAARTVALLGGVSAEEASEALARGDIRLVTATG